MIASRTIFSLLIIFPIVAVTWATAQNTRVDGVVKDSSGAGVTEASVVVQCGSSQRDERTNREGRFTFSALPCSSGTIEVSAHGFRTAHESWSVGSGDATSREIILQPASASEQVTVSATRMEVRLSETPGSTILLSGTDMAATPAVRIDDMLRQVPGFSLFRRSDSRTANPSNQGVSLRGLGGSAASRALVLEDGFPLVDEFGGWVYWDRVPRVSVANVEVFRGGASNLYGSDALGGVIQFIMRHPETRALTLETSYGNLRTPDLSLWTGTRVGKWDFSVASEVFHTDGFIQVPISQRGSVDTSVNSENATVDLNIGHQFGAKGRVFGRGSFFTEFRHNGTPLQTNDTQLGEGAVGVDQQFGRSDSLTLRAYGLVQSYNQAFSSVASNRNSESLTDLQYVPEQVGGGAAQWMHVLDKHQTLVAGLDLMEVIGTSDDQFFSSGTHTRNNTSGGRQRILGIFGEDIVRLSNWTFILAGRIDDWNNFNASSICIPLSGKCPSPSTSYPTESDLAFSPRLSVLRALNQNFSLTASVYRAFRAPTLNELYRTFRVANIVTLNNPFLNAERLTGAEAGVKFTALGRRLDVRGTFFWSDIVDPIQNVTIDLNSSPVLRQKQNAGRIRSRGIELDGIIRVSQDIQVTAGYTFIGATIASFEAEPSRVSLLGKDVAQVPRNVFTWEARYWNPSRLMASIEGRFVGQQFDDDQNLYPLARFYTMDVQVGRNITRNLELFAAAENFTNERYETANTPFGSGSLFNVGPPILYRVGLRVNFPVEK